MLVGDLCSLPGQHVRNIRYPELLLEEQLIIAPEVVQNIPNEHLGTSGLVRTRIKSHGRRLHGGLHSPLCSQRGHTPPPRFASPAQVEAAENRVRAGTWKRRGESRGLRLSVVTEHRSLNEISRGYLPTYLPRWTELVQKACREMRQALTSFFSAVTGWNLMGPLCIRYYSVTTDSRSLNGAILAWLKVIPRRQRLGGVTLSCLCFPEIATGIISMMSQSARQWTANSLTPNFLPETLPSFVR
jgi:hypothetical protein